MAEDKTTGSVAFPSGGQTGQVPAGAGQTDGAGEFYGWTHPDGKREAFKTKEDLDKAFKESYFRSSDYTKKTQTLAEFRKSVEQEKEELKKQREALEHKGREYQDFDYLIKNRPDVYNQLQNYLKAPASPEVALQGAQKYADEQVATLKEEIEQLKMYQKEQELQRQRDEVYGKMSKEYPDFDSEAVNELLDEVGSGDLEKLTRVLYLAHKGKSNPLEAEKRVAEAQKEKSNIKIMPSSGSQPASKHVPKNMDEAHRIALESLGIKGG